MVSRREYSKGAEQYVVEQRGFWRSGTMPQIWKNTSWIAITLIGIEIITYKPEWGKVCMLLLSLTLWGISHTTKRNDYNVRHDQSVKDHRSQDTLKEILSTTRTRVTLELDYRTYRILEEVKGRCGFKSRGAMINQILNEVLSGGNSEGKESLNTHN